MIDSNKIDGQTIQCDWCNREAKWKSGDEILKPTTADGKYTELRIISCPTCGQSLTIN